MFRSLITFIFVLCVFCVYNLLQTVYSRHENQEACFCKCLLLALLAQERVSTHELATILNPDKHDMKYMYTVFLFAFPNVFYGTEVKGNAEKFRPGSKIASH